MPRIFLAVLLTALGAGFTSWQAQTIRQLLAANGAPPWSAFINAVQVETLAFTDVAGAKTYIDSARFEGAPNTFASTIAHEIGHLKGMTHNSIPGDPMNFSVTLDQFGRIIDADHVWSFGPG
jgi:hypothetical protein